MLFFFRVVTGRKPAPSDSTGVIASVVSIADPSVRSAGSIAVLIGTGGWVILCIGIYGTVTCVMIGVSLLPCVALSL